MPAGLTDLLHDATVIHRLVDFMDEYCRGQERSQTYADASGEFFKYVENLSAGIKQELTSQVRRANRFPNRLPFLRSNMWTLKNYLRMLHVLIKPAADAHALSTPAPLVDLATDQLQSVRSMRGSRVVVLLTSEFMYFQRPHTEIKDQARIIEGFIPNANFPHKLGFIELPYTQGSSFFTNLAIYHEIGHFVYEELSNSDPPNPGFSRLRSSIARSVNRVFGAGRRDPQSSAILLEIIENWTQEIFCDLFAIRLVGPAFSFSFIEILGMLGSLSRSSAKTFNPTHPAPAFRLAEHLEMLRGDSWWDAISNVNPEQKKVLERLAKLPRSTYRFFLDERHSGPPVLVEEFLNAVAPEMRKLVREITARSASSAERFRKDREAVEECLLAGLVPHSRSTVPLNPISVINAAFLFYLTSLPELIKKFEKPEVRTDVEVYSEWTKRLEMWTMKAIDDSRLEERFRKLNGVNHGAHKS